MLRIDDIPHAQDLLSSDLLAMMMEDYRETEYYNIVQKENNIPGDYSAELLLNFAFSSY